MFYYVYVIESINNAKNLYIGFTYNLRKRIIEHNKGLNFSTKPYAPWKVIFYEAYLNEKDAKRREKYLKTSQGARLLKRMLKDHYFNKK